MSFVFQKLVAEITVPFTQNFISILLPSCVATYVFASTKEIVSLERLEKNPFHLTGKVPDIFETETFGYKMESALPGMNLQ